MTGESEARAGARRFDTAGGGRLDPNRPAAKTARGPSGDPRPEPGRRWSGFAISCAAIAVLSLVLRAAFPVIALSGASGDDALFVKLAGSLASGHWLGRFDNLTLVKGMFYPLFIATASLVHLPLKLAEQIVYLAACFATVALIRARLPRRSWFPVLMFLVLALDPIVWSVEFARVIREGVYIGLSLLLVALSIAISFGPTGSDDDGVLPASSDAGRKHRAFARWLSFRRIGAFGAGIATGLVGAAFWLTREEGIWIVPTIGLIVLVAGVAALSGGHRLRPAVAGLAVRWSTAAATFAVVILSVAATNDLHYGAFETTEVQSLPFRRAYAALADIDQEAWRRFVVFPKDARTKAYAVSPAARELAPSLDGASGDGWRQGGCAESGEVDCPEILAGWFQWALRDAVAAAGHYGSAAESARYYDRLADEIAAACESGALHCLAPRASLAPPFRWTYVADAIRDLPTMTGILFNFAYDSDPDTPLPTSEGDPGAVAAISRVVGPVWPVATVPETIEGWITSAGALLALTIETASGSPVDGGIDIGPAPDVAAAFPDRQSERFAIKTAGLDQGGSLVWATADARDSIPLATLMAGKQIERDGVTMHIDAGIDGQSREAVPRWRRALMAFARWITRLYVWIMPPAFAASVVGCGLAWLWRRYARLDPMIVASLVASAAAVCTRLALVSYLDVTAIPSANNLYPSPASPFLLLVVGIGCHLGGSAILGRWAARRRRTGTRQN